MPKFFKISFALSLIFMVIYFSIGSGGELAKEQEVASFDGDSSLFCQIGTATKEKFFVNNNDVPFYTAPNETSRVINGRASETFKRVEYRNLYRDLVLQGICETEDWLQAKIIEADGAPVDWETGWVEKRRIHTGASSDYAAGLVWDIESVKEFSPEEKALVREGALKVLSDEPNCLKITEGSRSDGKKGRYFVTCMAKKADGWPYFNVWFSTEDIKNKLKLTAPIAPDERVSRGRCLEEIKNRIKHPSTLDIKSFTGYATSVGVNGNREITQIFSAKNSFGLELKYRARCIIAPTGKLDIAFTEIQ